MATDASADAAAAEKKYGFTEAQLKDIRESFAAIDADSSGKISQEELKKVLNSIGEPVSDEDAAGMIKMADVDGDGQIDYAEFLRMMAVSEES